MSESAAVGFCADLEIISKSLGSETNMFINPYATASEGEQVSLSLLPCVSCSDRPSEHRQRPGPNTPPTVPLSTTPKKINTPTIWLE